jgi:hypothetical protein
MIKGDKMDYFGLAGYSNDELKKMGYIVWMPVQEKGSWIGEGDTFTFINMLGNGLRAWESGSYGGWGGKTSKVVTNIFSYPADTSAQSMISSITELSEKRTDEPVYPSFFPAAQRDFAARFKWSVTPDFSDANHEPVIKVEGPLNILVAAGEKIRLNGSVSDPDGDTVSVRWWQFRTGSYPGEVSITDMSSSKTELFIPKDATAGQTIHIVLEGSDNGSPSLSRYQRIIITVKDR